MANIQSTREWQEKIEIVKKLHNIMEQLMQKEHWEELETLYNGIAINTKMGSVSFSKPKEVDKWLTSHYVSLKSEINVNAYANLSRRFNGVRLGGKRTRRQQTRRQQTRRQKK